MHVLILPFNLIRKTKTIKKISVEKQVRFCEQGDQKRRQKIGSTFQRMRDSFHSSILFRLVNRITLFLFSFFSRVAPISSLHFITFVVAALSIV